MIKAEWYIVPLILSLGVTGTLWALGHKYILPYLWPFALAWILLLSSKYYKDFPVFTVCLIMESGRFPFFLWQLR